jgi:cell wall-active antibiotic response 4TMS protein YvqF
MLSSLRVERVVLGLGLIGLGTLWTLSNFDRIDLLVALRRFWPMLLIAWGALELVVSFARAPHARKVSR